MTTLAVLDMKGKSIEQMELPSDIFGGRLNTDVLHQAVVMYQASLRQGNASTKERADVKGSSKKLYRQKGTGQARAGASRSPLRHKGGVTFGPRPRDFGYTIPKKIRKAALRECLKAKCVDQDLHCIEDLQEAFTKTKDFAKVLSSLNLKGKILAVLDGSDASVARVSRNIPFFHIMRAQDVNAFDILRNKKLLVTKTAFRNLLTRLKDDSAVSLTNSEESAPATPKAGSSKKGIKG